jgi:hypothetical protein
MLIRLLVAGCLVAHAAIHVAFIGPAPPATAGGPAWPFTTTDSWLFTRLGVGPREARQVAFALVAVTLAAFALAAVVALGVVPAGLWEPALTMGAVASLGLLAAFFHPWLALGVVIDVALLWAGIVAGWTPWPASVAEL